MPYTTINLTVSLGNSTTNATTYTFSKTNTSFVAAQTVVASIEEYGGIWDDFNVWYPKAAILRVTAS